MSEMAGTETNSRTDSTNYTSSVRNSRPEYGLNEAIAGIRKRSLLILAISLAAATATALFTRLLIRQTYRATAVLRPINAAFSPAAELPTDYQSQWSSFLGVSLGPKSEFQEYIAILKSYAFSAEVSDQYQLAKDILGSDTSRTILDDPYKRHWRVYRAMLRRFSCDYDVRTGSLELSLIDENAKTAARVLELYITSLRDKLRRREVEGTSKAVESFEKEAANTADSLLRNQLYELIAKQIQRQTLAEVQADFAFTVIDPPVQPDRPYAPAPLQDALICGVLALMISMLGVSYSDYNRHLNQARAVSSVTRERPRAPFTLG